MAKPKNPYYQRPARKFMSIPITDGELQTLDLLAAEWKLPGHGAVIAQMVREFLDYLWRTGETEIHLLKPESMPRQRPAASIANR